MRMPSVTVCACAAGVKRTRLRKPSAVALCKRTTRFLLGVMHELGLNDDKEFGLSLDFAILEQYLRPVLDVVTARGKAQRKYQVSKFLDVSKLVRNRFSKSCDICSSGST